MNVLFSGFIHKNNLLREPAPLPAMYIIFQMLLLLQVDFPRNLAKSVTVE